MIKVTINHKRAGLFLQVIIISVAAFSLMAAEANAQGICVPEALRVNTVSGKVVSKLEKGEVPLIQASVMLLEDRYHGRVIAKATTDENGRFRFSKRTKEGRYVLKISYPNLADFYNRVQVISSRTKASRQEIVVTIGAEFTKPCSGSFAELRAKKDD